MTLLLGTYGQPSTPFYLYSYQSKDYMCLNDVDTIYFNNQLNTKATWIKDIYEAHPQDFLKETTSGRLFVMTRTLISIARLFNCYVLAELCKLSNHEILGNVAEPLFRLIQCDQWVATVITPVVLPSLQFESLTGHEWYTLSSTAAKDKPVLLKMEVNEQDNTLYRWLSSNIYESDSSTLQLLVDATQNKKQQQVIIETRLRKVAFRSNLKDTKRKNIAGNLHKKPKLPPSPPFHYKKRKMEQQKPDYLDNLTLLATQATQLRGLPLSPDVSPSPPPPLVFHKNSHRLPPLQTMLSGLHENHFKPQNITF